MTRIAVGMLVASLWCASAFAQGPTVSGWRLAIGTDARTIPDNGGGTAATLTLNPLTSHVAITCNDADGCAITMGETGLPGPAINSLARSLRVEIVNVSANAVTLADTAGVQELQSSISLAQWASTTCTYEATTWACGSAGGGAGTVTTTGSPASGNLAFFSGASSITSGNLSGDVTTSGAGAATIANDAVTYAKFQNVAALSVVGRASNSSGDSAAISASAASGSVLRESGSTIGFGTLATAGIADGAVTLPKIVDASAATRILCRGSASGSGDWEECTLGTAMSMAGTVISSTATGSGGGDVAGPSSATDHAVARFDGGTGKLLQDTSTLTLSDAGAFTFADGVKQTFNPNGTNAGINVGSQAGDPGSPANGDLWYDSSANELTARINGANVALGAGSSTSTTVVKSADESVTSSTVLQADNELVFALTTSAVYKVDGTLFVTGAQAGDIKVGFTVPTSATGQMGFVGPTVAATGNDNFSRSVSLTDFVTPDFFNLGVISTTVATAIQIRGAIFTAGSAGNLTLQWAQDSSSGTATNVLKGSWITVTLVP